MSTVALISGNRRCGADRRRTGWQALRSSLVHRRRRGPRRPEDLAGPGYYLDVVPREVLIAAMTVLICCCVDAVFTMRLLSMGAVEVNPFMRTLIEADILAFLLVKFGLTLLATAFLTTHANFRLLRLMRGKHALYGAATMYGALILYQLLLMSA
ncbi:MAG: DUF5658 family protein [Gammaproteobacteria bacterium]|nr:DUF5658 family protein [Gammaproteobacteria bacterium]